MQFILCLSDLCNFLYYLPVMIKKCGFFTALVCSFVVIQLEAATPMQNVVSANVADYVSPYSYNNMYPYLNNSMRTALNSGDSPSQAVSQIDVLTRTKQMAGTNERRVVARRGTSGTNARAAVGGANGNTTRRVVARRGVNVGQNARVATARAETRGVVARSSRYDNSVTVDRSTGPATTTAVNNVSSVRCLADYTECMNGYCQRENMAYNRCYCSAKLAQIDSMYKPAIENLVLQIMQLRGTGQWSDVEMNKYWMDTVGKYSGTNSWTNIDDALNIDWASTESRVRGQQAFATGHEYCSQHLRGCYYMASNLRDAYRSEIARDCAMYESSLQKLKNVAESVIESYK